MRSLRLAPGTRGAVYVEFLVAFLPLFIFFECLLQLAALHAAQLIVQHAAHCAARAAVVVLPDDPAHYGGTAPGQVAGRRRRDIERAAELPLQAAGRIALGEVELSVPDAAGSRRRFAPDEVVSVRLEARYECAFPIARRIVCSSRSGRITLVAHAALPNHGARYAYD